MFATNEVEINSGVAAGLIIFYLLFLAVSIFMWIYIFRDAKKRQQERGSTPWNLAPGIWFVISFFGGFIGWILYFVARSAHNKAPGGYGGGGYPQQGYPQQGGGYPPQQGGGYPPQQGGGYPHQQGGGYPPQQGQGGYPPPGQ